MAEWTTDLRKAQPGWEVEAVHTGALGGPGDGTYDVVKTGHVVSCADNSFLVAISSPLGDEELWRLGYSDTKVKVRPADG
jgi:hypothetical protein